MRLASTQGKKKSPKRTCRDLNSRLYNAGVERNNKIPQTGIKTKDSSNVGRDAKKRITDNQPFNETNKKNFEKSTENIWWFLKNSLPLHSLSGRNGRNNKTKSSATEFF